MSIELRQKLEDVKQQIKEQEEILVNKHSEIIDNYVQKIKTEFREFFEKKFFTVIESKNQIEANYYDLKVRLIFEDSDSEGYIGAKYVIDLETEGFEMEKRTIHLDLANLPKARPTKFYTRKPTLKDQISEIEQELAFLTEQVSNLPNEEWCLFLLPDQYEMGKRPSAHKTISELLNVVFPK